MTRAIVDPGAAGQMAELVRAPAFVVDPSGAVVACNAAAAGVLGRDRATIERRALAETVENGQATWRALEAAFAAHALAPVPAALRAAAGAVPCRLHVRALGAERTALLVIAVPDRDTGRLTELRLALEHVRALLDDLGARAFPDEHGLLLTDVEGHIEHASAAVGDLLGLPSGDLTGVRLADLGTWLALPEAATQPATALCTVRGADGKERVLRGHTTPLVSGGERIGQLTALSDASAGIERSHELAEKDRELDEARARLTRAQHLKALGELAAEVAHEFGNLLQAIGLQTAALRRQPALPEPVTRSLWSIKQAVDIGQALTRRLLTFARDDPNEHLTPLDVGRVLRDIVQLLEPRINKGTRPLHVELSLPPLPEVAGSQTKLTEAFLNLFLNALDAMPEGGTLQVSAVERSGEIRIAVRDSGKGMSREELARAFDPFFTTKPGGTGLGLSTVYGVVRAHGGSVFLESEPGKGTTVFVSLPTACPPAAVMRPAAVGRPLREAWRVLVVDDHPTVREATSQLLAAQGYEVESAGTVADALAAIEERRFTVVVTDVGLPDRPGWEVARAAKERSRDTVVVLVSGWGSHFSAEEARARGVDLVFEKPVDPDVLLSAIDREIQHSSAA
jgi:signal transduction histidine kinase/CheY-like chemotaxis protein